MWISFAFSLPEICLLLCFPKVKTTYNLNFLNKAYWMSLFHHFSHIRIIYLLLYEIISTWLELLDVIQDGLWCYFWLPELHHPTLKCSPCFIHLTPDTWKWNVQMEECVNAGLPHPPHEQNYNNINFLNF